MIVVPIYDLLLLPGVAFNFKKDILDKLNEKPRKDDEVLFIMLKEDRERKDMKPEDFYPVGVSGRVEAVDEEGNVRVRILERIDAEHIQTEGPTILADAAIRPEVEDLPFPEETKMVTHMREVLSAYVQQYQWGAMAKTYLRHWKTVYEMASAVAGYFEYPWEDKYQALLTDSRKERCAYLERMICEYVEMANVSEAAEKAQKESNEKQYRESAIRKQMSVLQKQLDDMHPEELSDAARFEKLLEASGISGEAREEAFKVLRKFKQEGQDSHEYGTLYDYLDFVTKLSWKQEETEPVDLRRAQQILDEDHYGLEKVKERIIEHLAVMALKGQPSGSVLLLVGAPGTGKTSIGQSIARALNRKYVRISLGGVRDEAEIRGHRRTYVGAMPGRILEGMKRSGSMNPVMVLDEVDKLSKDYAGDPASALLEVLDPEQNHTFADHYMNAPYDLSGVFFVCTANSTDTIPEALLNRMEVIRFPGYTSSEKFHIAREHLFPQALERNGLTEKKLKVSDEAIRRIIAGYTAESGVRGLKKQLDKLCRGAAVLLVRGDKTRLSISEKRVPAFLGNQEIPHEQIRRDNPAGVVTGLAWTSAGGEVLFIETLLTPGKGKVIITGQLGEVMQESARIALSLVESLYPRAAEIMENHDLHIHVPAGATPKDGPSAGITMTTALMSLFTGRRVCPETAMTGEISLTGRIMPIGGLPEKLGAAQRAGIKNVFIPRDNLRDLEEVAPEVKRSLTILPVSAVREVLESSALFIEETAPAVK